MAGQNQHYLPRFILKGFINKKHEVEAIYKNKEEEPKFKRIKTFGAEHLFNAKDESDIELDSLITDLESTIHSKLVKIRDLNEKTVQLDDNDNPQLNKQDLKNFNKYLLLSFLRVKSLRDKIMQNFIKIGDNENNLNSIKNIFINDFDRMIELMYIFQDNEDIDMEIIDKIKKDENLKNMVKNAIENEIFISKDISNFGKNNTKEIHNGILMNLLSNKLTEVDLITDNNVYLVKTNSDIILPDTLIMSIDIEDNVSSEINNSTQSVILPLSYNKYILISKNLFEFDIDALNEKIASISEQFFICRDVNKESFECLKYLIGTKSNLKSKEEVIFLIQNNLKK